MSATEGLRISPRRSVPISFGQKNQSVSDNKNETFQSFNGTDPID